MFFPQSLVGNMFRLSLSSNSISNYNTSRSHSLGKGDDSNEGDGRGLKTEGDSGGGLKIGCSRFFSHGFWI